MAEGSAEQDRVVLWHRRRLHWLEFLGNLASLAGADDERVYSVEASPRGLLVRDPRRRSRSATGAPERFSGQRRRHAAFVAWAEIARVENVYVPSFSTPWFARIVKHDGSTVELSLGHLSSTSVHERTSESAAKVAEIATWLQRYTCSS